MAVPAQSMPPTPAHTTLSAPAAPVRMTLAGILTRLWTLRFTGQVTLHFLGGRVQFAEWGKPERYLIAADQQDPGGSSPSDDRA